MGNKTIIIVQDESYFKIIKAKYLKYQKFLYMFISLHEYIYLLT
jgi:hypothetical protein